MNFRGPALDLENSRAPHFGLTVGITVVDIIPDEQPTSQEIQLVILSLAKTEH